MMHFPEQEKEEISENRKNTLFKHSRLSPWNEAVWNVKRGIFSDFHQVLLFLGLESKSISLAYSLFKKTKT
jgi:hypothetical protein